MPDEEIKKEDTKTENKKEDIISVDVYGVSIPLPVETARSIIERRDERHKVFKDLDQKVKDYEQKIADTKRQADAQKAALEGKLAESEQLFSQKANEKLANIQNHLINREIEAALLSDEAFIKESKDDALKLLKADLKFSMSEDGTTILAGDKPASEAVKSWLKDKSIFRKATGTTPTGAKVGPKSKEMKREPEKVSMSQALAKHLNNKK